MITINNIKRTTLNYKCECGAVGQCMFKAPEGDLALIIDLQCPMCDDVERIKIIKYSTEEKKLQLLTDDTELHWAIVVDNIVEGQY